MISCFSCFSWFLLPDPVCINTRGERTPPMMRTSGVIRPTIAVLGPDRGEWTHRPRRRRASPGGPSPRSPTPGTAATRRPGWRRTSCRTSPTAATGPRTSTPRRRPTRATAPRLHGTFDNGATVGEVRFLARAFVATDGAPLSRRLRSRRSTTSSPRSTPAAAGRRRPRPARGMPVTSRSTTTRWSTCWSCSATRPAPTTSRSSTARRREAAGRAFDAGIACILKCQIRVDGKLTVWCAQHDEMTLEPARRRSVRAAVAQRLGERRHPDAADEPGRPGPGRRPGGRAGARWFEASKLTGIRQAVVDGDKKIVADPKAPPLWARFYEIGTNRPFFCGRDGVKKAAWPRSRPSGATATPGTATGAAASWSDTPAGKRSGTTERTGRRDHGGRKKSNHESRESSRIN